MAGRDGIALAQSGVCFPTRHGPPNAECKKKLVKTASERVARRSLLQHSRTARRGTLILRSPAPCDFASWLAGPSRFSEGGW